MAYADLPEEEDSPIVVEGGPDVGERGKGLVIRCKGGGFHRNGPSAVTVRLAGFSIDTLRVHGCDEKHWDLKGKNWQLTLQEPGWFFSTVDEGQTLLVSVNGTLTEVPPDPTGPGFQDSNDVAPANLVLKVGDGPAEPIACWVGHKFSLRFKYSKEKTTSFASAR